MAPTNEFLTFGQGSLANVQTQAVYSADANRPLGNQPGIASSAFNNKALRQANAVAAQLAQHISNFTGLDVLDNGIPANLLALIRTTFEPFAPIYSSIASSTTFNLTYRFFCASAAATAGATYTNNGITYTVVTTIAAGTVLICTGAGAPSLSGTLTKSAGTGDATITFYASRAPLWIEYSLQAGGGGGGGCNAASGAAGGGGAGGFVRGTLSSIASITSGLSITVGAGGIAGTSAGTSGSTGGSSTIAGTGITTVTVTGGLGGLGTTSTGGVGGGAGGALSAGSPVYFQTGATGGSGFYANSVGIVFGGYGGASPFGGGGNGGFPNVSGPGVAAVAFGGGGGGGIGATVAGGLGGIGLVQLVQHWQ